MFAVNRKDAGGRYIDAEGDYTVTVSKVEETLDAKGREVCKVTFKTEDGASITDRYINQENVWFRVTQVDFLGTKGSYAAFLKTMIGLELLITARSEEYQVNGETKKTLRIKNMREVPIAEVDADDVDPKPF